MCVLTISESRAKIWSVRYTLVSVVTTAVHFKVLSSQPRVAVTSCVVYEVIGDIIDRPLVY